MHLVIDAHNLRSGGGRIHVTSLLKYAETPQPFGKVTVVCHPGLGMELEPLARTRPWLDVHTVGILERGIVARRLWHDRAFPRLLDTLRPDALFAPGGVLPRRLPTRTRAVVLIQNMLLFQPREAARYGPGLHRLRLEFLRRRVRASIQAADGLVFPSSFGRFKATLAVPGTRARVAVIPNGVDPRFRLPDPAARAARAPRRLLYVSTIDAYKHQDRVVLALALLRRRGYHDLHLDLAGTPRAPMIGQVRAAIVEERLQAHVTITPWVPHDRLPETCAAAHIGLFASSSETCPNALLEMMAAGLPMVCSDRLPMPDFCASDAEYADPENPEALAGAIARLLDDPARRTRSAVGLAARARKYDWRTCATSTLGFIGDVALRVR